MAISLAQAAVTGNGTTIVITASGGNLLTLQSAFYRNVGAASGLAESTPTDSIGSWSIAVAQTPQQNFAAGDECGSSIFYQDNSGSGTHTVTPQNNSAQHRTLCEWSGANTASFDVATSNKTNNGGTQFQSLSTGTTGATAQTDELVLAACTLAAQGGSTTLAFVDPGGFTNLQKVNNDSTDLGTCHSYKTTAGATESGTFSWSDTEANQFCGTSIATFTAAAASIDITPGAWSWAGSQSAFTRGPETAFQQNAFQSNAFQIYGGSTGGVTTINQTIGTWTWAGSTASIAVQQVNQPTGTWTWAGSTQSFTQLINQITGAWSWAGSTASITVPQINQTTGTWTWAGSTASIPVQQVNQTTGAWSWAGSTQDFTQLLNQVTGTWTWAGTTQQITTPGGATTIDQVTGTWNWAGIQSTLDPQSINATVGTWSWTGAQSIQSQSIDSTPGLWTWSGSQAEIISQITIDITPGLWDWAGTQSSITSEAIDLGGGVPGKRRYRKRFQVEIDGEVFEVRSEEEALTLLQRVKDLAEQKVSEVVKRSFDNIDKPIRRPKRKVLNDARRALVAPEITTSRWVSDSAQSISIEIGDLYKEALKTIEIGVLMRINAELDDEEAILLLL